MNEVEWVCRNRVKWVTRLNDIAKGDSKESKTLAMNELVFTPNYSFIQHFPSTVVEGGFTRSIRNTIQCMVNTDQ